MSYQKKDWRGPARQSFFWYDNDKDLKVGFPDLVSDIYNLHKMRMIYITDASILFVSISLMGVVIPSSPKVSHRNTKFMQRQYKDCLNIY